MKLEQMPRYPLLCGFTPLQLANYVSAIVNGGTLYKPTLVKSIKSYDYSSFMKTDESDTLSWTRHISKMSILFRFWAANA